MKRISLTATMIENSVNYNQARMVRVDKVCEECGTTKIPQRVYGTLYIPKKLGIPEEIRMVIKPGEEEKTE